MRDRHVQAEARERAGESCLVTGLEIRVQEADRDRARPGSPHGSHDATNRARRERRLDAPVDQDPLHHAQAETTRHERRAEHGHQIVETRADLAPDREHVLEARRRDERHPRTAPLEERVGRDGGAVVQARPSVGADRGERHSHGTTRIVRRRAYLVHDQPPADDGHQVREGAAGIGAGEDDAWGQDAVVAGVVEPDFVSAFDLDSLFDVASPFEPDDSDVEPPLVSDFASPSFAPFLASARG